MSINYNFPPYGLGEQVTEGDVKTDANGLATVNIPAPAKSGRQQYTLEVTLTDESGLPVSARSSIYVNPADYYIGVHPDAWSYQAKSDAGFTVLVADWEGNPAGARNLSAQFQRVVWVRHDPSADTLGYMFPTYEAVYTPIASDYSHHGCRWHGSPDIHPTRAGHLPAGRLGGWHADPGDHLGGWGGPGSLAFPAQPAPAPGGG